MVNGSLCCGKNLLLTTAIAIALIIVTIVFSNIENIESAVFVKHQKKNEKTHTDNSNNATKLIINNSNLRLKDVDAYVSNFTSKKYNVDQDDGMILLNGLPLKHPKAGTNVVWYGPYAFNESALITKFLPVVNVSFVHHLVVYKYGEVENRKPMRRRNSDVPIVHGQNAIIYSWAKTGQKTAKPFKTFNGSGFWVGPGTDIGSIYLNVHYEIPQNIISSGADISMSLKMEVEKKTKHQVSTFVKCNKNQENCDGYFGLAVTILGKSQFVLPPNTNDVEVVHTCEITRDVTIYAYRNHAHEAGREFVTDMFRDGIKIGELIRRNVSDPQIFYTLNEHGGIKLRTGDILQLHCHYQTIGRDYETVAGAELSKGHEMCNQYLMYYPHIMNSPSICKKNYVSSDKGGRYVADPLGHLGHLGEVSGVAASIDGNEMYVLARRENKYASKHYIEDDTIFVLDAKTGKVKRRFGKHLLVTPHGLACDHYGNLWVTDTTLHQIFRIDAINGDVTLTLGTARTNGWSEELFNGPTDVVADPKRDEIYISDGYGNCRVAVFSYNGTYLREWGNHIRGAGIGQFDIVHNVAIDVSRDQIFVADRENCRVQVFDRFGNILQVWKAEDSYCKVSSSHPWYSHLSSVAYSAHLDLVITIEGSYVVGRNPENGKQVFSFGNTTVFNWPHDVDIALNEKMPSIYVAELDAHRMQRFHIQTDFITKKHKLWDNKQKRWIVH